MMMEDAMDEQETTSTDEHTEAEAQPQLREWVTPAFKQIALRDAFSGSGATVSDGNLGCS